MAVLFADPGGEYYFSLGVAGAVTAGIWNGIGGGAQLANNAPAGRAAATDGKIYAINLGANNFAFRVLPANYSHVIIGYALYVGSTSWSNSTQQIFLFQDGTSTQCDLRVDNSGHLFFTRNGTTIGSVSTQQLSAGWHYVEAEIIFATTATGSITAWLDGAQIINASSVQTAATGNAFTNRFNYITPTTGYVKDMYLLDAATAPNTARLGDVTIAVQYPNGPGVNNAWSPNSGLAANEWQLVDDGTSHTGTWPDGDSTFIFSQVAGQIADFAHTGLVLMGSIISVVHAGYMRKDDAGARQAALVCLSSGTTETSATQSLGNSYLYFFDVLDQDPHGSTGAINLLISDSLNNWNDRAQGANFPFDSGAGTPGNPGNALVNVTTGAAWTLSGFNAATFGVKEIS